MNNIALHIEYLLQRNDCVVVPRLGAFIVRHIEAHYDSIKRQFFPPTATVIFNPELDHNDGLLAKSIARANSISYDEALQDLTQQVAAIKESLKTDGHVEIGSIGSFSFDGKRRTFTPKGKYSIVHKLASLSPLAVTTVQMRADDADDTSAKSISKALIKHLDNLFRVAASIILIVLVGLLCSTPISVDSANITYASVYPSVNEQTDATPVQPEPELNVVETPATPQAEIEVEEPAIDLTDTNNGVHFDMTDPYILVVASFDSLSKAKKFMKSKSNQDYDMSVVENNGRYRVYAATGKSKDLAASALNNADFAKRFPEAWPCEKKSY